MRGISPRLIKFGPTEAGDARAVPEPDASCSIRKNPQHTFSRQTIGKVPSYKALTVKAVQPTLRCDPDSVLVVDVHRVHRTTCQAIELGVSMKFAGVEDNDIPLV